MTDAIAQFARAKYLNLESFRRNGVGVRTPVWFASESGTLFYVYSEADAGKVKRIRNNPRIRIAPCNFRGSLRGAWIDARARICPPDEAVHGQQQLRKKYGLPKIVADFFARIAGHKHVLIAVEFS